MSERYCAWIRIGGRIERSKLEPLLKAISQSYIRLDWGEPPFEPRDADELLDARQDGGLRLCDEEARYGEFPQLEETYRKLGLAYQRFCEAWCGSDAGITDWRPGMKEPLVHACSNDDSDIVLVDAATVKEALTTLEAGRIPEALSKLKSLCATVPDLPPFEIV